MEIMHVAKRLRRALIEPTFISQPRNSAAYESHFKYERRKLSFVARPRRLSVAARTWCVQRRYLRRARIVSRSVVR
jgi:hypothetical protein